jgi:hypothetical protein
MMILQRKISQFLKICPGAFQNPEISGNPKISKEFPYFGEKAMIFRVF